MKPIPPVLLLAWLLLPGCGGDSPPAPPPSAAPVHLHRAPHGGTLVELGEEFAHVELLVDGTTGAATAFVLDGEAEGSFPVAQPALEFTGRRDGPEFPFALAAVANPLTGETVGRTSEFRGRCDALRGATPTG